MRDACLPLLVATGAVLLLPASAAAQRDPFVLPVESRRVDVSASAGLGLSTDWSDLVLLGSVSPVTGAFEQVLARDLVIDPGPVFDATVTYWEGRYGFRAHAGYASSCLAVGRRCGGLSSLVSTGFDSVDVDAWQYDIGGAIGLLDYRRTPWIWPYAFFGVGGVTYDLEQSVGPPLGIFIERSPPAASGQQLVLTRDRTDTLLIAIDELGIETQLAFNFGVGTDFRIPIGPAGVGLRFEISDHIHGSPLSVRIADVDQVNAGGGSRVDFGLVHNLRASAGLVVHFGR